MTAADVALAVQAEADAGTAATLWANWTAGSVAEWVARYWEVKAYALSHAAADH
jgi:hypothetical protein